MGKLRKMIPQWAQSYHRGKVPGDLTAALVVAMLLVPQSMAYSALAGLPPHIGLYASVLSLVAYALAGSSAVLAVEPLAPDRSIAATSAAIGSTPVTGWRCCGWTGPSSLATPRLWPAASSRACAGAGRPVRHDSVTASSMEEGP